MDEVGEIVPSVQLRLLRVLQEKEIMRVGGRGFFHVDVRIIAATNQDLRKLMAEKKIREDLFYRLNVLNIYLPPLTIRENDSLILFRHFLRLFSLPDGVLEKMVRIATPYILKHPWTGNIRELESFTHRLGVLIQMFDPEEATEERLNYIIEESLEENYTDKELDQGRLTDFDSLKYTYQHKQLESIRTAFNSAGLKKVTAAKALGISRTTLWRKLKKNELS